MRDGVGVIAYGAVFVCVCVCVCVCCYCSRSLDEMEEFECHIHEKDGNSKRRGIYWS